MKTMVIACAFALGMLGCGHAPPPVAKVEEPEQKFIALGELVCKKHDMLAQVLMENTETFFGKFQDSGYRRAKESEMILIFLCKNEKVFAMRGANFESLRPVEIPQQLEHQESPMPKSKKPEVLL